MATCDGGKRSGSPLCGDPNWVPCNLPDSACEWDCSCGREPCEALATLVAAAAEAAKEAVLQSHCTLQLAANLAVATLKRKRDEEPHVLVTFSQLAGDIYRVPLAEVRHLIGVVGRVRAQERTLSRPLEEEYQKCKRTAVESWTEKGYACQQPDDDVLITIGPLCDKLLVL